MLRQGLTGPLFPIGIEHLIYMIFVVVVRQMGIKADSYAYEKLIRKWTKSVFFFGTKNMSEGHLMHTVLVC